MRKHDDGHLLRLPEPSDAVALVRRLRSSLVSFTGAWRSRANEWRRTLRWDKSTSLLRPKRLLLTGLLATGLAFAGLRLNNAPPVTPGYRTEGVKRHSLIQQVTAGGRVEPARLAEIRGVVPGQMDEVLVDFGSTVRAGQALARVEPTPYRLALKEAQINLMNAQAALDLASRREEQVKTLTSEGLLPKAEYDKAVGERRQAQGSVKIADMAVTRAQWNLDRCTIRASIDGVIISRSIGTGQPVSADNGATPLFTIAGDMTKMVVAANVAEADIGSVRPGLQATFTVDAFPDRTFPGNVTQIRSLATVDQNVVSYPAIIEADNPDLNLRPGMTASVSIVITRRDDVLTIPNKALRFHPSDAGHGERDHPGAGDENGRSTVYRLAAGPGGSEAPVGPEPVLITTGLTDGRRTEVLDGLNEGDRLIVGLESKDSQEEGLLARIPRLFAGDTSRHKRR